MKYNNYVLMIILIIILIVLSYYVKSIKTIDYKVKHKCSSCSGNKIDDLMNPAYNMHSMIEQSILLEEHLAIPSKRCRDCCLKHLHHLHGLAIESNMLAGSNSDKYPYIKENIVIYKEVLDIFLDTNDESKYGIMIDKLRAHRKKLMEVYIK